MEFERQMKMSDWIARPRPVVIRDVFLSNLNDLFSAYDSFDPRAGGIGCPLRYRPTLFTLESPSLSSRDVNVNRGETFVTRYGPSERSKQNGD